MDARETANTLKEVLCDPKTVIACVGTELRRDDLAGLALCDMLKKAGIDDNKIVECHYGLENCYTELLERRPKALIIIDAVLPREKTSGRYVVAELDNVIANYLATTHNIPITISIAYLKMNGIAEEVKILGIVAEDLTFGEGMSPSVENAVKDLANELAKVLQSCRDVATAELREQLSH